MPLENKRLKNAIAEANRELESAEKLREKLNYYICKYNAERCARINLQDAYCKLIDVVERQKKASLISRSLSYTAFVLSLISLLL